jgi:hypothetical protein
MESILVTPWPGSVKDVQNMRPELIDDQPAKIWLNFIPLAVLLLVAWRRCLGVEEESTSVEAVPAT